MRKTPPAALLDALTSEERLEQRLGSVRHQLWVCACGRTDKVATPAGRRHSVCATCHRRTKLTTTTMTQAPTELTTGLARVTEACENCGHRGDFESVLPVLVVVAQDLNASQAGSFDSSSSSSSDGGGSSGSW